MPKYRHLELLSRGSVTGVRILDHRPTGPENVAELASEWNFAADHADCQAFLMDLSNLQFLSSEMLSRLILLQRRLAEKNAKLILTGLRAQIREVLSWTRLDRFFEITEDEEQEAVSLA